jgi:hypothetical protein
VVIWLICAKILENELAYSNITAKELQTMPLEELLDRSQKAHKVVGIESIKNMLTDIMNSYDELEWRTEKMYMMDRVTVLCGIPQAKDGGVDAGNKGMGNKTVNPDAQDTTEEYIAGMSDKEYILQIISSPVKAEHLKSRSQ